MTFKSKSLLASTALAMTMTTAAVADEFRIDRLFVVGDSLSDGGAYSQVITASNPAAPDIRYRFLNNAADGSSQVYAERVAEGLGIGLEPNFINGVVASDGMGGAVTVAEPIPVGGRNFAQGGSRVAEGTDGTNNITQIPSTVQVDRLLAATPRFTGNDLVIYWVGANDISTNAEAVADAATAAGIAAAQAGGSQADIQLAVGAATQQSSQQAGQAVGLAATQALGQVQRLIDAGATNLVVVTIPDLGTQTPVGTAAGPRGAALLSGLTAAYNQILVDGVAGRATVVDAGAVLGDVLADPVRYGFAAVDHTSLANTKCNNPLDDSALQCIDGFTTQPGNFVFADDRHPTALTHRTLGELALSALVAIGQAGVIPVATISGLRQQSVGLEQRLNLGAFFVNDDEGNRIRRPIGNVEIYGGGEVGFYESDPQQVVPGFDATTQVLKVAADVMVSDNVMLGVGASIDHGQIDYAGDVGGFDERLFVGGVFGVAQIIPGVYVNGFLGGGLIDVYDIDRSFTTTSLSGDVISRNNYSADTDGTYFIARTNVGAVLPIGNGFAVNPSVGFAFERVDIDGYNERARDGAPGALAARVGDLEYVGHRGTVALGGFYRPPSDPTWTFGLRASYEHDFNDDNVEVPFAVGTSPTNVQVAPRPDDSYGLLAATVVKELTHDTSLSFQGTTNFAQDGVTGYTASLVFKHTF